MRQQLDQLNFFSMYLGLTSFCCDHRREGLISRQAFFEGIIQEERNEFGNAIFTLVDPEDEEMLEFG